MRDTWPTELRLTPDGFNLHVVPIINLREDSSNPIDFDGTLAFDSPGLLVQLLDFRLLTARAGFDLTQVTAEIANLVQGVPCGHLYRESIRNIGHTHAHVEYMAFRICQ